jgi:hypothetical protein
MGHAFVNGRCIRCGCDWRGTVPSCGGSAVSDVRNLLACISVLEAERDALRKRVAELEAERDAAGDWRKLCL